MTKRKVVFLSGTRADFGKLKSLIQITKKRNEFEAHIFATGMHLQEKYGYTVDEIEKSGFKNIYKYINYTSEESMDRTLAKTIQGFSDYIQAVRPDLIVIHGDRVETLAGAIVGSLNNILVAHVEGGELSGTIDELIRHAVSKLSHIHFVSNEPAKKRLIQMGELEDNIFVIGSPDVDLMVSEYLPTLEDAKKRYAIEYDQFAILMFHPVTTESSYMTAYAKELVEAVIESRLNYIVIYPNNDLGSSLILDEYKRFNNNPKIRIFPSIRFEYFLVLLKNSKMLVGNSSAGIREAPYYGIPVVNIGSRQMNRTLHSDIINCSYNKEDILCSISLAEKSIFQKAKLYGNGNSDKLFIERLLSDDLWCIKKQKQFKDI